MTYAIQDLVIRDVAPIDTTETTGSSGVALWFPLPPRIRPPASLEATDPHDRDRHLRHGYVCRSVIRRPDGPPLWRSPMP